jgi:phenylalanyl-tRNA synthetase beta chain
VLGVELGADAVATILERLSMQPKRQDDSFVVVPPSYRFDLAIEEDLIEEIARIHGYDRIEARPVVAAPAMLPLPESLGSVRELRGILALRDFHEIVTYAFVDPGFESDFGNAPALKLANPIASQMSVMRTTLLNGLVDRLRFNLNRRQDRVRLFEVGSVFLSATDERQPVRIAAIACGPALPEQWGVAGRSVDFFDLKADLEALAHPATLAFEPATHPALHPGRAARVLLAGNPVGWIGELHPQWQQKYQLALAPIAFELDVYALLQGSVPSYREVSRFPMVRRDLAVVVAEHVAAGSVHRCLAAAAPGVVSEVRLFDEYRGKGLETGKKSLAFRILLQDTQRTLTDEEADAAIAALVAAAEQEHGASLRK